ncbi:mitochondrial import receptor subunit TOM40 [Pseudohyphozyma bogoriensis]|nr:mitochondrial import receptor subunit TOM40 [Pseudohyphozyma bogoriensis]
MSSAELKTPVSPVVPAPASYSASLPSFLSPLGSALDTLHAARERLNLPDPGKSEDFGREVKMTHLTNFTFDGARADLAKTFSQMPAFQVTHQFAAGAMGATGPSPGTYNFGAVYATNQTLMQGSVDNDGSVSGRWNYSWTPQNTTKISVNLPGTAASEPMIAIEHDRVGKDYTLNLKGFNPSPADLTGNYQATYLQSLTPHFAVGVEGVYQRPSPQVEDCALGYLAKWHHFKKDEQGQPAKDSWIATAQIMAQGMWQATYWRKLADRIDAAAEIMMVPSLVPTERKAIATAGAKYDFRAASVRVQADSTGTTAVLMEQRLTPQFAFLVAGELNHLKNTSKFGVGINIESADEAVMAEAYAQQTGQPALESVPMDVDDSNQTPVLDTSAVPSPSQPASPATTLPSEAEAASLNAFLSATSTRRALFEPRPRDPAQTSCAIEALSTIPHGGQIHSLAVPPCSTNIYTGGSDGFIRRYNLHAVLNGARGDDVVKPAGVSGALPDFKGAIPPVAYWENELPGPWVEELALRPSSVDPEADVSVRWAPKAAPLSPLAPSPVYSLAVQRDELWGLAGTASGTINLFTIRHDEGQIRHVFGSSLDNAAAGHRPNTPVSVLTLDAAETSFLSGGWDGRILEWDLNTGATIRDYVGHDGQISSISYRPVASAIPSPKEEPQDADMADAFDDEDRKTSDPSGSAETNGADGNVASPASDTSSSTGVAATLVQSTTATNGDEKPPAANGAEPAVPSISLVDDASEADADGEEDADGEIDDSALPPFSSSATMNGTSALPNGTSKSLPLPAREKRSKSVPFVGTEGLPELSGDVFMSTSIDGDVMLWDKRVKGGASGGVRKLASSTDARGRPQAWCASACWSPSGNQIYVGRRNNAVDVYDLRHSSPSTPVVETLRLPSVSGAVTSVAALPSGKLLLTASHDNVRLWDLRSSTPKGRPFKVIPGHHGGAVSSLRYRVADLSRPPTDEWQPWPPSAAGTSTSTRYPPPSSHPTPGDAPFFAGTGYEVQQSSSSSQRGLPYLGAPTPTSIASSQGQQVYHPVTHPLQPPDHLSFPQQYSRDDISTYTLPNQPGQLRWNAQTVEHQAAGSRQQPWVDTSRPSSSGRHGSVSSRPSSSASLPPLDHTRDLLHSPLAPRPHASSPISPTFPSISSPSITAPITSPYYHDPHAPYPPAYPVARPTSSHAHSSGSPPTVYPSPLGNHPSALSLQHPVHPTQTLYSPPLPDNSHSQPFLIPASLPQTHSLVAPTPSNFAFPLYPSLDNPYLLPTPSTATSDRRESQDRPPAPAGDEVVKAARQRDIHHQTAQPLAYNTARITTTGAKPQCGEQAGKAILRGEDLEFPVKVVFTCLTAVDRLQGLKIADDHAPPISPDALSEIPDTLRDSAMCCDVCARVMGVGSVASAVPGHKPKFSLELICERCTRLYMPCSDCGGGGGRLTSGRWRSKELFPQGRRTCRLSHFRFPALTQLTHEIHLIRDLQPVVLKDLERQCRELYFNSRLGVIARPDMLERGDGLARSYAEAEKTTIDGWNLLVQLLREDVEPQRQIRRYLAIHTAPNLGRRGNKVRPDSEEGKPIERLMTGFQLIEYDLRGTVLFAVSVPWSLSGPAYEATTALGEVAMRRLKDDRVELNRARAAANVALLPPIQFLWIVSPFKRESRWSNGIEQRGYVPLDEFLQTEPDVPIDLETFPPLRQCYIPSQYMKGFLVWVRHLKGEDDLGKPPAEGTKRRKVKRK